MTGVGVALGGVGTAHRVRNVRPRGRRGWRCLVRSSGAVGGGSAEGERVACVVVGSGVSGMSAAFRAQRDIAAGKGRGRVVVTEGRDRVGGNVTTRKADGFLWEEGPNSFQPGDGIMTAAYDAGCGDDLVLADPTSKRWVLWDGTLHALPAGPEDVLFDLLTWPGKLRAGMGVVGLKPPPPPGVEESVEQWVRRNLGAEAFERLIEPFCSGVYAGDPSKLSAEAAVNKVWRLEGLGGSLGGGMLKVMEEKKAAAESAPPRDPRLPVIKGSTVGSFRDGLITLPLTQQKALEADGGEVRLEHKLVGITKRGKDFVLEYDTPGGKTTLVTPRVFVTAPAYALAEVLKSNVPAAATALEQFYYPPVCAATIAYPTKDFQVLPSGFGQLHPRSQGVRTLGTIYSSELFPGRVPDGWTMVLNYIGGAQDVAIGDMSESEIVDIVDADARKTLLKPDAPKPKVLGVRTWHKAIPQFNVGHNALLADVRSALEAAGMGESDGLTLGGNFVFGVALGKCVEAGTEVGRTLGKQVLADKSAASDKVGSAKK